MSEANLQRFHPRRGALRHPALNKLAWVLFRNYVHHCPCEDWLAWGEKHFRETGCRKNAQLRNDLHIFAAHRRNSRQGSRDFGSIDRTRTHDRKRLSHGAGERRVLGSGDALRAQGNFLYRGCGQGSRDSSSSFAAPSSRGSCPLCGGGLAGGLTEAFVGGERSLLQGDY